ncbi:MAG: DUF362 domain-containing protein, partial [Oscillospiraceae bacterium]|nr:DUF362 domain-containing protein [Oscillospiraceae bacterium]
IVPCTSYEIQDCRKALEEVLAPLGGLDWVTEGMCIVIKTNLVAAMKPEAAATTHPALLSALTEMLCERGARVIIGDSPGGLYNAAHLNHVYDAAGLRACEAAGAKLNRNFSVRETDFSDAVCAKHFTYTAYLDQADAIIDFCKLKSHGMMGMTCAAKNFFGIIPGTMKPEYHYQYPKVEDFADMLVDLAEFCKPRLCICDAVISMEGNGPTQGSPCPIGALAAGFSSHKLDLACAYLIGLCKEDVPTLQAAFLRGLIPAEITSLRISGDIERFRVKDFKTPKSQRSTAFRYGGDGLFGRICQKFIVHALTPKPNLHAKTCIGCEKCAKICPAGAITMKNGKPSIDRSRCIRCFCCQEFCPKGALYVHRTAIARLLSR